MPSNTKFFICTSALAAILATSTLVIGPTASQWGKAAAETGVNMLDAKEHKFHAVADDPILVDKTKSALSNDPITRNHPIMVSANRGTLTLKGEVPTTVAGRALEVAASINGVKSVDDEMAYAGKSQAKSLPDAPPPYEATAPAEKIAPPTDIK